MLHLHMVEVPSEATRDRFNQIGCAALARMVRENSEEFPLEACMIDVARHYLNGLGADT